MTRLFPRLTWIAIVVVLLAAVAGSTPWWPFWGNPASATVLEDACAAATLHQHLISTTEGTTTYGTTAHNWHRVTRYAPNGHHQTMSNTPGGVVQAEIIYLYGTSGTGGRSDSPPVAYLKEGSGPWITETAPGGPASGGGESGTQSSGNSPKSPVPGLSTFCGIPLSQFDSFEYVGEETLSGSTTKHFLAVRDPLGSEDEDSMKWDLWVNADGLVVQMKETVVSSGNSGVATTTFSNWGEANTITAPVQATPSPTVTPTPEATATLPPPTPEPTATPRPTNTPAPGAWLDPDPSTITLRGEWRVFRVRGSESVNLKINVLGPGRKGTVLHSDDRWPPPVEDPCRSASTATHSKDVGDSFRLVGCRSGKAVVQLLDTSNALIREYVIRVRR